MTVSLNRDQACLLITIRDQLYLSRSHSVPRSRMMMLTATSCSLQESRVTIPPLPPFVKPPDEGEYWDVFVTCTNEPRNFVVVPLMTIHKLNQLDDNLTAEFKVSYARRSQLISFVFLTWHLHCCGEAAGLDTNLFAS